MKRVKDYWELIFDFLLIFLVMIFSFSLVAVELPADPVSRQILKLRTDLSLDRVQIDAVREVLEDETRQKHEDRESNKGNAVALLDAARKRREILVNRILALLDERQKEEYLKIVRLDPMERELFGLTEGLCLDEVQEFTVEGILIDFYNKLEEMIPEEMRDRLEEGDPPGIGRSRGRRAGMRHGGGMMGMMGNIRSEKVKEIKKILSGNQKKLYNQLRKHWKKRFKEAFTKQS